MEIEVAYSCDQRLFFSPRRLFFGVNAASVSIRKKYPLEPRVLLLQTLV